MDHELRQRAPVSDNWRKGRLNSVVKILSEARMKQPDLPVDQILPELAAALANGSAAVLMAPPGAGKTTRVPLVLAQQSWAAERKIIVLEPRRLAARAAAERMARTL